MLAMTRTQRGVTLMELMIVVVIVALLAVLGYPSYASYMVRANRTEGRAALLQYASEQEKFILNNNTYATSMAQLRGEGDPTFTTTSGRYVISISNATASTYTLTATYQGTDSEKDKCQTFTITETAERDSAPRGDCWDK